MRTLKLAVEYDGTEFLGFQTQGLEDRTVQSVLAEAIRPLVPEDAVILHAAGRTDTGVHALGQVVSFRTESRLATERWAIAINSRLPPDLSVASAEEAPNAFHARFSARARTYRYAIWTRRTQSALWARYSMHLRRPVDIVRMRQAAQPLVGVHDFAGYARTSRSHGPTTVRHLKRLSIRALPSGLMIVTITANAFLRSMVRNIVGMLVDVGRGDRPVSFSEEMLALRDRARNPSATAAPQGLCLWRVYY